CRLASTAGADRTDPCQALRHRPEQAREREAGDPRRPGRSQRLIHLSSGHRTALLRLNKEHILTTTRILTIAIDDTTDVPDGQIAELIHRLIPGSHTLSNTELSADLTDFEWDLEDESALELPLKATEAGTLMDGDGDVRSEERRVGKGGRSRRSTGHCEKKR